MDYVPDTFFKVLDVFHTPKVPMDPTLIPAGLTVGYDFRRF